jgi:hypothetical protein
MNLQSTDVHQKVTMQLNFRFIAYGAIVALVYKTIVSSLDDISRLIIVGALVALFVIIEKRAEFLISVP